MGEVASPKSLDGGEKINSILNFCDSAEGIYDAFINPKYKVIETILFLWSNPTETTMIQVGTEWVCKTQNTNSCEVSTVFIITAIIVIIITIIMIIIRSAPAPSSRTSTVVSSVTLSTCAT